MLLDEGGLGREADSADAEDGDNNHRWSGQGGDEGSRGGGGGGGGCEVLLLLECLEELLLLSLCGLQWRLERDHRLSTAERVDGRRRTQQRLSADRPLPLKVEDEATRVREDHSSGDAAKAAVRQQWSSEQ